MAAAPKTVADPSNDRKRALDAALGQIERQFGKGAIMRVANDGPVVPVETISTGSLGLDIALGVGGLPKGRIVEIYGPESSGKTTLTLHVLAEAQKRGLTCAFVDAEHALDTQYAKALGVNLEDLLISQPGTGEEGLNITEMLARSGAVDVIIVDSVAALTPQKELEGDVGDSTMGVQARMMSQAMRKLTAVVSKNNVLLIFINQIRMKIGVMFGCFHYNARVLLADGTTEKIGKIVNQKMPVEVMSFNGNTGAIEPRRVVQWFDNGNADSFLQMTVSGGKSGRRKFGVTANHTIFTPTGEVCAGELAVGDEVLATAPDLTFSGQALQVLLGSALGDASVRMGKNGNRASVRFGHGAEQMDYAAWKHSFLSTASNGFTVNTKGQPRFDIRTSTFGALLNSWIRIPGVPARKKMISRRADPALVAQMDALAFAVWYMDDGSFGGSYDQWGKGKMEISAKATDRESLQLLADRITALGGGTPKVGKRGLVFDAESTWAFHTMVAPFVPDSMAYKLHPKLRATASQARPNPAQDIGTKLGTIVEKILHIGIKPKTRSMRRFDLEVEGNHCYLVDGVVVHNSPETTTGGNALKFYASVRMDIRRTGTVKEKDVAVANSTRVKVVKNKVASPFREAEFEIVFGKGISKLGELVDLGVKAGVVDKSGSWFSYGDERIGQGKEKAKEFLAQHPDVADAIEAQIRAASGAVIANTPTSAADNAED
jgi:recombination protein RecA